MTSVAKLIDETADQYIALVRARSTFRNIRTFTTDKVIFDMAGEEINRIDAALERNREKVA